MKVKITTRPPKLSGDVVLREGRIEKPFPWLWVGAGGFLFFGLLAFLGRTVYVDLKNKAEWAKFVFAEVTALLPQLSVKSRAMIVAHAALESGWGQSRSMNKGTNNLFNITAGSQWKGAKIVDVGGDTDAAGKSITQTWRVYPSYRDAIRDYWDFLGPNQNGGRYLPARQALEASDVGGFVQKLYAARYFELAPDKYLALYSGVVDSVAKRLEVTI